MIITGIAFFTLYLFYRKTVTGFLALFISVSIMSSFFIGGRTSGNFTFSILIINTILFLIIFGFRKYNLTEIIDSYDTDKYIFIYRYISLFSLTGVIVNLIMLGTSFRQFMSLGTTINAFKNQGIAVDYINSSGLGIFSTASLLFSPFSYITLGYHFYFFYKNEKKNAVNSMLLLINIFLPNLIYLSRAGASTFVLIYLAYWYYVRNIFPFAVRKKVKKTVLKTIGAVMIILVLISQNRFSAGIVTAEFSLVKDPVLYSIFWYFSQWFNNGIILISRYNSNLNLKGSSFAYIINTFKEILGFEILDIKILRESAFGNLATHFNGLPAVLVYDFGYSGAIIFSMIFLFIVRRYSPREGKISLNNLLLFSVFIPMPVMFFQGNHFTSAVFNLAIVYIVLLRLLVIRFIKVKSLNK